MRKRLLKILCAAGLIIGGVETTTAGPFKSAPADLMLCFRQAGATLDVEVNIGQASLYFNVTPGATFAVTGFTSNQLYTAFGSPFANVLWSASTATNAAGVFPKNTMWLTAPRVDVNTQSTPWLRASSTIQGSTVSPINTIQTSAITYSSSIPPGVNNTATAVLIPDGDGLSYHSIITDNGNFGAFQGNVENLTSATFAAGEFSRSDLYEIRPNAGGGPATYLGYFDLFPNGTMTFTAAGGAAPPPPVISITNTSVLIGTNGASNAVFTVTLSTNFASTVSVNYATQDGTATAGTDYTATSGTLSFTAGQTNLTLNVSALGRTTFKNSVNFTLLLSSPVNGTLGTNLATGTIVDGFLPVISAQGITRANNASVITFPSFSGVSYTLRYTNIAGLLTPIRTWPIVTSSVNGSGLTLSLTNNTTDSGGVYVLQATRLP